MERSDGVAEVTLDHPPLNLFDESMIEAVIEAIAGLSADPPRAVLFRAEGDVVSGGVNVEEFQGLTADQGRALWTRLMDEVIAPVEALPCPVVFSSHGLTLTAAFELALACDLLIASESASFGLVEIVVGLTCRRSVWGRCSRFGPPVRRCWQSRQAGRFSWSGRNW